MKNSTFSAQVANNLLTLLQGYSKNIRLLLVMFLTLTVTTNAWGATWEKATSIAAGDVVLLVCESKKMELSGISTTSTKYGTGVSYTTSPAGAYELTVEAGSSTGTYSLKNGSNYLYWSSGNSLATNATKSANSSWSITFNDGNATIKNAKDNARIIGWNASSPRFACYTSSQTAVQLYKKVTAVQTVAVTGVSLNPTSLTLTVGSSETLSASVSPDNATDKTVTWTTNKSSVATVSDGKVTAVAEGSATITVTTNDGNKTATCTVTVTPKPKYTVTLNAGSGSVTNTTLTEASAGVTLPTPTLDCGDWEFAGWATSAVATETSSKPATLLTGTYKPTSNITLYAVYKRTETTDGGGGGGVATGTISFVNTTQRDSRTNEQQVWSNEDIIFTNNKSSSTTNVADYSNPARFYANSQIIISAPGAITQIVADCDKSKYATALSNSIEDYNTVSGVNITITPSESSNTYTIVSLSAQTRLNSLTVTYTSGGGSSSTTYYHSTPDCGGVDPEPTGYTITFEANGGTRIDKITDATALPDPLPTTTRDHYTFAGWFTDEDCTQAATAGATINANTTLYAKWTPITYTVTFDAGSGTYTSGDIQGNFETGLELPTATPCPYASTNGWSFVGWSETTVSETTVRPAIHTGNYKPTKTITLHAVYAKTGTAQGAAGEFILSLQYEGTTYYVGQTFDNNKLSAETEQTNAARFTIEDNYLHYEGGYISHVATTSSPNITKQADKANAKAWTITEEANTVIFTSTADNTRGLGFNYNSGSPRFAAYQLSNDDYPSTFTKTSVSDAAIDVTTYNSNPSCEAPIDPTWDKATIDHNTIQVACGSKTQLGAAAPNGPATITFNGYDLVNPVTVTASEDFLVSTDKVNDAGYKSEVTITPHKEGQNVGKLQNVYVIAQAPAQSGNYDGTIILTGTDITDGSQTINVTAAVTCTQYTITWSISGDETQKTTFYAGGDWELPENPTFDCNGRVFVGWTNTEILQPQDIAPNVLYKEQGEFPTIESDRTFYAVFAQEGTGDGSGTATVTDVLNREWTDVSGTTYKDWNGKTATSSAVYAGNSAGGNESIQLRSDASKDAAGIITTTSGGKATKVIVAWHNGTAADRTLNVYGKNSAYSAVADLRGENTRGTLLGTIVNGTSTSLTINDDYEYIGLCSKSGAMYLTSIAITWETDGEGDGNATTYTSYTTSCADVKAIRIVEPRTKTFNEGDKFVFDGEVWAINSDDSETDVTNSPLVHFDVDMNKVGTQTVTVSYLGFTATYEITINAVEKWQITWNVSGATNTGLGPKEVAKGTAIGKLPQPKEIPAGCTGKEFRGWTESNTVNSDGSNIEWITEETVPTANTTYYAVFAKNSGEDSGDGNYVKLTDTPADLSGEYLIVYEDAENNYDGAKAFDGGLTTLDAASNTINVTIIGNTIASTDDTDAAEFTIAPYNGGYSIKSASGYFIGQTSYDNDLASHTTTQYINNIAIESSNAIISCSTNGGDVTLKYNKTSGQTRFRYYKTGQQPIALYKQSGSSASYTDYTTGCHDVTITYYGFTGGYTTNCSDLNVIKQRVNSAHTIPNCGNITDPTNLGRTFLNLWKDQNGKVHQPGESFIVTQDITLYAQWKLETTGDIELPADKEDLATTDIVVTGGKTLTIPEDETITINSLTLKGGLLGENSESGYAMPSVVIPDGAKLVRKNTTINFDIVVNADSWYPFAVPFAIDDNSNIDYLDPVLKAASTYNTHFAIKTYDGKNRAIVGTDQENNWDKVLQTAGLQPGKGYIISALTYPDKDTATIRIPMSVPNEWLANGEQTTVNDVTRNAVAVTAYTGAAATEHQRHAGWNFVANPYLSNFAGTNANGSFINGEILINKGDYSYGGEDVPYVTIPTYNFEHYYQLKLSDATLSPAYSFFVQVGTDGTMTFDVAGRQAAPASIAARNAEERPVKMDVDITLSDNHSSDQTGIIISDRYSEAYEIGRDLEKLFGSAYNLSVYTLMADNTPLAFQALAIRSNMQVIPVGYRAPEQGEYTFRLNTNTSSIDLLNEQYEQLVLVDYQTGELTNLLISDYTFYSERTQTDNRFAIYAVPRQNAPTDLPNAIGQDKEAQKIIHNGHLYILRDGNVYNGNGQIVK